MTLEVTPLPRPGACVLTPSAARASRAVAIGYASAAGPVETDAWTRLHAGIENHAYERGLPRLKVFSDDEFQCRGRPASHRRRNPVTGLPRDGHVGLLIVPSLKHLSLAREGSHPMFVWLLNLHFGTRADEFQAKEEAPGQSVKACGVAPRPHAADVFVRILPDGQPDSPLGHTRSAASPGWAT